MFRFFVLEQDKNTDLDNAFCSVSCDALCTGTKIDKVGETKMMNKDFIVRCKNPSTVVVRQCYWRGSRKCLCPNIY